MTRTLHWALAIFGVLGASGCRNEAVRHDTEPSGYSELTEEPPIPLARAIALARERAPGEPFLHAELGRDDGRANCLVVFWGTRGFHLLIVDARDGKFLYEDTLEDELEAGAQARTTAERSSSAIGHAKAIEIAVATLPGSWARLIDLEGEGGPLVYLVEVVAGEVERAVRVGAVDGKLCGEPSEELDFGASVSLASAIKSAMRLEPDAIVLEAGLDLSSSKLPRDWEVLLAKSDQQLRVRINAHTGFILHSQRDAAGEMARTLGAAGGVIEVSRAIDAALLAVQGLAPDVEATAALLADRNKGLVYQIVLSGSSSGTRIVDVSARDCTVLSVEAVETPNVVPR